ncbi:MAG: hypothetical protein GX591_10690 [Planctomycetes bacterium]|nr:hypothetical protein [Planctomycetota bacterium]
MKRDGVPRRWMVFGAALMIAALFILRDSLSLILNRPEKIAPLQECFGFRDAVLLRDEGHQKVFLVL